MAKMFRSLNSGQCVLATLIFSVVLLNHCEWSQASEITEGQKWADYVIKCLDTLLEHGTDHYGPVKTPLIMAVIDVKTLESPENPELFDSLVRLEEGRLHRRGERGSNLWYDQALLRSMYRAANLTGNAKYSRAADAYIDYFFKNCHKPDDHKSVYRNGMPCWGNTSVGYPPRS